MKITRDILESKGFSFTEGVFTNGVHMIHLNEDDEYFFEPCGEIGGGREGSFISNVTELNELLKLNKPMKFR